MSEPSANSPSKSAGKISLPYFDELFVALRQGNTAVEQSFGRHVHWGYWENRRAATLSAEDFGQATEELSRQVCLAAQLGNDLKVLDVGCGFGGTIAHLNENFSGLDLTGINIDERQLDRARTLVHARQGNTVNFKQGNACALPLPDEIFDVVLAVECIFHFPSRKSFFQEAWRVLKPGGFLALSDFVSHPALSPFVKIKSLESINWGFYGKCNLDFAIQDYHDLARLCGYTITTERDITLNTLPTYSYLRRLGRQYKIRNLFAVIETAGAELFSKLGLMNYYILGFQKPLDTDIR